MIDLFDAMDGEKEFEEERFDDPHQIIPYVDYRAPQDEIKYDSGNRLYTWDDEKARLNKEKHHITFRLASQVFDDPHYVDYWDDEESEQRIDIIGRVQTGRKALLFVVYAQRSFAEDRRPIYRIISARRASEREVAIYNENFGRND